jgi:hypothetical protein
VTAQIFVADDALESTEYGRAGPAGYIPIEW